VSADGEPVGRDRLAVADAFQEGVSADDVLVLACRRAGRGRGEGGGSESRGVRRTGRRTDARARQYLLGQKIRADDDDDDDDDARAREERTRTTRAGAEARAPVTVTVCVFDCPLRASIFDAASIASARGLLARDLT
jgi:hypothetical protein